jgi:hypothetical protein
VVVVWLVRETSRHGKTAVGRRWGPLIVGIRKGGVEGANNGWWVGGWNEGAIATD